MCLVETIRLLSVLEKWLNSSWLCYQSEEVQLSTYCKRLLDVGSSWSLQLLGAHRSLQDLISKQKCDKELNWEWTWQRRYLYVFKCLSDCTDICVSPDFGLDSMGEEEESSLLLYLLPSLQLLSRPPPRPPAADFTSFEWATDGQRGQRLCLLMWLSGEELHDSNQHQNWPRFVSNFLNSTSNKSVQTSLDNSDASLNSRDKDDTEVTVSTDIYRLPECLSEQVLENQPDHNHNQNSNYNLTLTLPTDPRVTALESEQCSWDKTVRNIHTDMNLCQQTWFHISSVNTEKTDKMIKRVFSVSKCKHLQLLLRNRQQLVSSLRGKQQSQETSRRF